jgi:hypothetical protein
MYLYVTLKLASYDNKLNIFSKNLLSNYVHWSKNETLKKHLILLREYGYIEYNFNDFPMNKPLEIRNLPLDEPFTQVDNITIKKIIECAKQTTVWKGSKDNKSKHMEDVKEMAVKLFYYYCCYYNADLGKAFTKYEQIHNETKISNTYIKSINNMFSENKLVDITIGDFYKYETDDGKVMNIRPKNKYIPICNVKKKRKTTNP